MNADENPITRAIELAGQVSVIADACKVSRQAVLKWQRAGRLPRTEWTGETIHHKNILSIPAIHEAMTPQDFGLIVTANNNDNQ